VGRSPRRIYFAGAGLVLIFLAVNAWVAIDHFQLERLSLNQTVDGLKGVRLLAAQRSVLLSARPDGGPIDLQMMQKAGVRVPDSFSDGYGFLSPWGHTQIFRQGNLLVWDFYEITIASCRQLLEESSTIAGVISVAASARGADEKAPPISREVAAQECRRTPLMGRLILKER
jgi:hypothetical protein